MSQPTSYPAKMPEPSPYRRAFVRYPCNPAVSCQEVGGDRFHFRWGDILDISQGGIGLLVNRAFAADTPLTILLKFPERDFLCELQARVVNCSPRGEDRWQIGCQFVTPLREEQVKALL